MRWTQFNEGVGRITKQNQTVDVGPNEISIQAAKFGNKVDKDGRPANMKKKVKGSKTNVLFNLGMTESVDNLYESVLYYRQMKENLGEIAQATEIYVDMDGVLADFFGEWAKLMKVDHFSKIDKEHKIGDALQAIRDKDEFWLNLPLLPQAKQLLSVIKQIKGEYNICSSPLADDPNSEPHKREWIKKNLAFFPPKEVIITHNKPEYATQQDGTPNILIDDYGVNVDAWEAAGGTAFKYKDHKFERTANAIKQHMQEPVAEDKETNKKTQDAATQKAKPYDMPIRKDIADLIIQSYPEIEKIWVTSDQYGIVGTKLKNGPTVLKLQRQLKKDGYPITVDGKAQGEIKIDLFEYVAPMHVSQILNLADQGQYDNVVFHRVIEGFMAQTGDVEYGKAGGDIALAGRGGSALPDLPAEFSDIKFDRGIVGMARTQNPNSANSQFFVMFDAGYFLNGQYTVVGKVISGMKVVDQIKIGEGPNGAVLGVADSMVSVEAYR